MKLAIMQPYFLPYIGYFQLIKAVDKFVIFDDVNYIKKGWINRNNILVNNKSHLFTISLNGASQNKLINEIEIIDDFSKFKKMVDMNYHKAPYFFEVTEILETILNFPNKNLALFVYNSIQLICNYLGVETEMLLSSQIIKDNHLKGQNKILDMCRILHADTYINAIGGQELYDKETFANYKIELQFLKPELCPYSQKIKEFVPYLSILDVMMWNNKGEIQSMLKRYTFI